ncbi:MAG: hypothetical protein ACYDG2_13880 [Ruminiclostridium sp.]
MKFLAKINRGLILIILIVAAIAIFLVTQSISQAKVMPKIKDVCQQYINTAVSYRQLPEEYRKENMEIPPAELNKYIDAMTKDLKAFYTDNEQTYKYLVGRYKENLENQAKGEGVVFNYKKDIEEYKTFTFEGNTVTVTIATDSVLDGPNSVLPGAPRENISAQTIDTITLQKTDGEWKVVYADLQEPMLQSGNEAQMTRTYID